MDQTKTLLYETIIKTNPRQPASFYTDVVAQTADNNSLTSCDTKHNKTFHSHLLLIIVRGHREDNVISDYKF